MNALTYILLTGIGATVVMDIWGIARKPLLGIRPPDYGLVGRWLGHMVFGKFHHASITDSSPIPRERLIGWTAHYLIGITFTAILIILWGDDWIQSPSLTPALIVGIATVAVPFLLMQPGMGAGIAASKTPNPGSARLQSLITHTIFGFGMYISGWGVHAIFSRLCW